MNLVKISTVAPPSMSVEANTSHEETVNRMISHLRRQLEQVLPDRPDLILMPEVCDRPLKEGFNEAEQRAYYLVRGNRIRDAIAEIARENRCYIVYPAVMQLDDGTWRNAAQLIGRDGSVVGAYYKNHLVIEEYTQEGSLYGTEAPVFECDFGRVACVICFDLNFEQIRVKYQQAKPDIIVFPSLYHGGLMQSYWAYSCRAHFVASVRALPSAILSPVGEIIAQTAHLSRFVTATVNLDCKVVHYDHNHLRFPDIKRKYGAKVKIHDADHLGCTLISSETDEFDIDHVIQEFGLETIDDYFDRAIAHRDASICM